MVDYAILQATRSRVNCTRNWKTISLVYLSLKKSLAHTIERNQYWAQVHLCGIPINTKKYFYDFN